MNDDKGDVPYQQYMRLRKKLSGKVLTCNVKFSTKQKRIG